MIYKVTNTNEQINFKENKTYYLKMLSRFFFVMEFETFVCVGFRKQGFIF